MHRDTLDLHDWLEDLNASLRISLSGAEIGGSVSPCTAVEPVGSESASKRVIVAATFQRIVASFAEQLVITSNAVQGIVAATPTQQIVANLAIDIITGICAHHHVYARGTVQLAVVKFSIIWPTDDAILSIDIDRGRLTVAHRDGRCAGRCLRSGGC